MLPPIPLCWAVTAKVAVEPESLLFQDVGLPTFALGVKVWVVPLPLPNPHDYLIVTGRRPDGKRGYVSRPMFVPELTDYRPVRVWFKTVYDALLRTRNDSDGLDWIPPGEAGEQDMRSAAWTLSEWATSA